MPAREDGSDGAVRVGDGDADAEADPEPVAVARALGGSDARSSGSMAWR